MKINNLTVKFADSQHVMYLTSDIGFLLRVDMAICEVRTFVLTDTGSNTSGSHYTVRTVRTQMGEVLTHWMRYHPSTKPLWQGSLDSQL